MILALILHRQLTSLAENFDGLLQRLNKILQANQGETLDNLRFSSNKSLQRKNDLKKTALADTFAREFHVGGNSPLPPARRWPCFDFCFSSSMGEFGRKLQPHSAMDYTISYRHNPAEPLINRSLWVINHYYEENSHALDLETPDGFPNGMAPPKKIGKRRLVERGRPGQEWLVDLFGQPVQPRFAMDFRCNRH